MADTVGALIETVGDTSEMEGRYLTFWTDGQLFGVPIADVVQIVGMQEVTEIPEFPVYAKGIINLRGKVVPVIDVRLKFNQPERPYDDKTCIIVVTVDGMQVGLIVDSVAEVVTVGADQSSAPPDLGSRSGDKYLSAIAKVGDKVILNIDCDKFFQSDLQLY